MPSAGVGATILSSTQIADGIITNDDINAAAAIAASKLAADVATQAELDTHAGLEGNDTHIPSTGITNDHVAAAAAIADTKLATISTAGKVDGAALTGFANIPAGAGVIPAANVPSSGMAKLGETTLGANGISISVASFSAKEVLKVWGHGFGISGRSITFTFNSDTGANYATKSVNMGGSDTAWTFGGGTDQAGVVTPRNLGVADVATWELTVTNIAGRVKTGMLVISHEDNDSAMPGCEIIWFTWNNTAAQISTITVTSSDGIEQFTAGSFMTVYGADVA